MEETTLQILTISDEEYEIIKQKEEEREQIERSIFFTSLSILTPYRKELYYGNNIQQSEQSERRQEKQQPFHGYNSETERRHSRQNEETL